MTYGSDNGGGGNVRRGRHNDGKEASTRLPSERSERVLHGFVDAEREMVYGADCGDNAVKYLVKIDLFFFVLWPSSTAKTTAAAGTATT